MDDGQTTSALFMMRLSKSLIENLSIPGGKAFTAVGSLAYCLHLAFMNEAVNSPKKITEIGFASVATAGTISSTISGVILGQLLIPVPILGAFIGGMMGGYISSKGFNWMRNKLDNRSGKKLIAYLAKTVR